LDLTPFVGDIASERFDDLVPPALLAGAFVNEFLDIPGSRFVVGIALSQCGY